VQCVNFSRGTLLGFKVFMGKISRGMWEMSGGLFGRRIFRWRVNFSRWKCAVGMSGANCAGCVSVSLCKTTGFYVQWLWFEPPWLTHRHTNRQVLTIYTPAELNSQKEVIPIPQKMTCCQLSQPHGAKTFKIKYQIRYLLLSSNSLGLGNATNNAQLCKKGQICLFYCTHSWQRSLVHMTMIVLSRIYPK